LWIHGIRDEVIPYHQPAWFKHPPHFNGQTPSVLLVEHGAENSRLHYHIKRRGSIRQVLGGLGFDEADFQRPLTQLSGGQQTRAHLARLLLDAPDLLLLDEPTNHLDVGVVSGGYLFTGSAFLAGPFLCLAIERLGQVDCQSHLADVLRPDEQVRMRRRACFQAVLEQ
jgi:hypothetical protein